MLDTSLQGYAGLGALKPEDAFEDAVSAAAGFVSRLIRYKVPYQLYIDGAGIDRRNEYKDVFKGGGHVSSVCLRSANRERSCKGPKLREVSFSLAKE